MKNFTNTYIFLYAAGLVILVAALLSFAAVQLKPLQTKNIENKKKQNILASINVESTAADADVQYSKYITNTFVINSKGETIEGDAFKVNMKKELAKPVEEMSLPVYEYTLDDGVKGIIVPMRGKGLGGAIWGFIAFKEDMNTAVGTTFDHEAETPGLGAKITLKEFQTSFKDKTIFDESGNFVSISLYKGGKADGDPHAVDAISGGTITSGGVNDMLKDCLVNYETFFKNNGK